MSLHSCHTGVARLNGRRRQHPRWAVAPMLVLCLIVLADDASAQAPEPEPEQKPATELSQLTLQELTELKIDSVYGASRYTQKVTEAPSSVTIVTREEIRKYGHRRSPTFCAACADSTSPTIGTIAISAFVVFPGLATTTPASSCSSMVTDSTTTSLAARSSGPSSRWTSISSIVSRSSAGRARRFTAPARSSP